MPTKPDSLYPRGKTNICLNDWFRATHSTCLKSSWVEKIKIIWRPSFHNFVWNTSGLLSPHDQQTLKIVLKLWSLVFLNFHIIFLHHDWPSHTSPLIMKVTAATFKYFYTSFLLFYTSWCFLPFTSLLYR